MSSQIDPQAFVHAWLDAHLDHPSNLNPLTQGLTNSLLSPRNTPRRRPRSNSLSSHWGSVQEPSFARLPIAPKRPRLIMNAGGSELEDTVSDYGTPHHGKAELSFAPSRGGGKFVPMRENSEGGGQDIRSVPDPSFDTSLPDADSDLVTAWDSGVRTSFAASLSNGDVLMPPPGKGKRKAKSISPSKMSSDSTKRKRIDLSRCFPAGTFGVPDLADLEPEDELLMPEGVISLLAHFAVGSFETQCFPSTLEIEQLHRKYFRHEPIPRHALLHVTNTDDQPRALALIEFAIEIHRSCLRNSRSAADETDWYQLVRDLLSIEPAIPGSAIPSPPRHRYGQRQTHHDLFLTIDATTKLTTAGLPPHAIVKLDALLAFNPAHRMCKDIATRNIQMNAFNDCALDRTIVILGVEVKSSSGGPLEAEYQVGVWGMKTLNLTKRLANRDAGNCNYAFSLSVCAHVWSLHVTYWRGEEIVTHGPVVVGATDTLYGTMKIVAFVRMFKEWARDELWPDWKAMLEGASENAV